MREFYEDVVVPVAGIWMAVLLMLMAILAPVAYLQGRANARYLKETTGKDWPWYEAAFLDVKAVSIDANVNINPR